MSVRVVRDVECPTCKGTGNAGGGSFARTDRGRVYQQDVCPDCNGVGRVTETVTCATCRHLDTRGINHPFCEVLDDERAEPDLFGCTAWEPRT